MKFMAALFIVTALVEGFTFHQAMNGRALHWMHHLYTPIAYALLALALSKWQANKVVRQGLLVSIPFFAVMCVWNIAAGARIDSLNDTTQSLANIVFVLVSALTLLNLLHRDLGTIHKEYRFWIASAVLIYSAGSLSYFVLHNIISSEHFVIAWYFHIGINIAANTIYTVGVLCHYRHR